jgi:flavodoxin
MKTVVVYESMFGNTRSIANAIAEGWLELAR